MIYKNIRNLREDRDMTQAQIAKKLGISQRAYSYYENGERTLTPEILIAISKIHNVSVDYLLGLTDDCTPKK
ncbi:MAG: helix-turn-helix domain-containing protein [Clostridiales bacterium]|nr:helix-turn-helix domain-containing protein [Clostridiales bacterium]